MHLLLLNSTKYVNINKSLCFHQIKKNTRKEALISMLRNVE